MAIRSCRGGVGGRSKALAAAVAGGDVARGGGLSVDVKVAAMPCLAPAIKREPGELGRGPGEVAGLLRPAVPALRRCSEGPLVL